MDPNDFLKATHERVINGEEVFDTGRKLLELFGFYRRGTSKVRIVREALNAANLFTEPDFNDVWIDDQFQYKLRVQPAAEPAAEKMEVGELAPEEIFETKDPTYRVNRLRSANQGVLTVHPDETVEKAVTLMLSHNFSQLPVMESERKVVGIVSWRSIGMRTQLGRECKTVRDAMDSPEVVSESDSIFSVIPKIIANDYALVRKPDNKISGIITASDLGEQLRELSEPFLLLGEIESHLRVLIDKHFAPDDLKKYLDPGDEREVKSAADLSIGEYQWMLQEQSNWNKVGLKLDRVEVMKQLDKVRQIRNEVMHFDPEGIESEDLEKLRAFVNLLRDLRRVNAF